MDQNVNKIYISQLSNPEEFPQIDIINLPEYQKKINEIYAEIMAIQKDMCVPLITVEDKHKDFYTKFDKILK